MSYCRFGHYYNVYDEIARYCPYCYMAYRRFCDNLPPGWHEALGHDAFGHGRDPTFEEWEEEQTIKQQSHNGEISTAEAEVRVKALKDRIRKRCHPSQADIEEWRRVAAAREAAKPKTVFDLPSLL